jgi:proteasome lid subunit RPN8/RPN11
MLPIYINSVGTFHSHPINSFKPSNADLDFFSRLGKRHLIVAYPYVPESIGVYDSFGKIEKLEVV